MNLVLMTERLTIQIDAQTFAETFKSSADAEVKRSFSDKDSFEFTEENKYVLNQIYFHLIGSNKFKGNLNKNIYLVGPHKTGKSTIMKAIKNTIEFNTNPAKIVTMCMMDELNEMVKRNGIEHYYKRPIILDELGRETKKIMVFGNEIYPSVHLLGMRYKNHALTYAVGNFSMNEMRGIYDTYMFEKIHEMFEVIELKEKRWIPEIKQKKMEL